MSAKERDRLAVVRRVVAGELGQVRAGELLGLGVRQVKRLVSAFRRRGDRGLVSGKRGKPSNNQLEPSTIARIELALRERYPDFGATFAAEKLAEHEGLHVSKETVRRLQTRLGLHIPRERRTKRVFQLRERRPRFGELIQIDGSVHDWLEGRGPKMTLIVFIDDATGRLRRRGHTEPRCAHISWRMAFRLPCIRTDTAFSVSMRRTVTAAMASPSLVV